MGATVGAAVAAIWQHSLQVQARSCTDASVVCLGPAFGGLIAGAMVVLAGTLTGFALLRIRPLAASLPAAAGLALAAVTGVDTASAGPAGEIPSPWLISPVLAVGFALVAAACLLSSRARIAALGVLGVFVLGALLAPTEIGHRVQSSKERASLEALPVPLELPVVSGYKVGEALPQNGTTLWVSMVADNAQRNQYGAYEGLPPITVTISPAAAEAGVPGTPVRGYTAPVVSHNLGSTIVTFIHGKVAVTATANISSVPVSALEQAVTNLRPVTADQIQASSATDPLADG